MMVVAFICFFALVAAWFMAASAEGAPEHTTEAAPRLVEAKTTF